MGKISRLRLTGSSKKNSYERGVTECELDVLLGNDAPKEEAREPDTSAKNRITRLRDVTGRG